MIKILPVLLLSSLSLVAQTVTIRGKVEDVQGTQNQFHLDGTTIRLVSSALNLNTWIGQQAILDVVDIGTAQAPQLRVDAATATTKVFDMGNLRFGQAGRWQVNAPTGSFALMFLDFTSNTGFLPYSNFGAWLLGSSPATIAAGFTNGQNQFQAQFFTPANPQFLGLQITSQAFVGDHGNWFFSNPDNKTIEQ